MAKNLVIQLARFGDLVQTKRLILSLKAEGEVHLALDASLAPLAALVYPGVRLHPLKAHGGGSPADALAQNAKTFAALKAENFDAVYNINRNPMSLAMAALFEPERVTGYRMENGQPVTSTWAKMAARLTARRRVSAINLVDFWAFFHRNPIDPAKVNPIARPQNAPGSGAGQRIGVALAGREARRSLPPAYLAPMLDALFTARKGPNFVFLGGKSEEGAARMLAKSIMPQAAARVEDLTGKTSLEDLHEVVSGLDMLVTPDTGIMHLAAHLGVPVMATFLSSAWVWETGPYGMGHLIWQAVRPCSPCLESAPCRYDVACLEAFRSPDFLAHLGGRHSGSWPDGLLGMVSTLDTLGVSYLCVDGGNDDASEKEALERLGRRSMLAEYLGLWPQGSRLDTIPACLADEILSISDWTLPDYGYAE